MRVNSREAAISLLANPRSAKRRSGAKWLRKHPDPENVDALIAALTKELRDVRTWETQYQMIMALGASGSDRVTHVLEAALRLPVEPMVRLAVGDALVRLSDDVDGALIDALESSSSFRVEGALRALAMTHRAPEKATTAAAVVDFVTRPANAQLRFWLAASAAGWEPSYVREFLDSCLLDSNEDLRRAAEASLQRTYLKWNPL